MKHYKSIDFLPVFNYFKAIETENINWIRKDYEGEEIEVSQDVYNAWKNIELEVITEMLKDEGYKKALKAKKKLILMQIKAVTGNALDKLKYKHQLQLESTEPNKLDFMTQLAELETAKKITINEHKTSVKKYISHLLTLK